MYKTVGISTVTRIMTPKGDYILEQSDIETLVEALTYAQDALDMDNLTAIDTLDKVIKILQEE